MKEKIFKKGITRRLLSVVFTLTMVFTLMPSVKANAMIGFEEPELSITLYPSGCLKSMDIDLKLTANYGTAYGRVAVHNENVLNNYNWGNFYKTGQEDWSNFDEEELKRDAGLVAIQTADDAFDFTVPESHNTVEFEDGVVDLNTDQTYYVYLWSRQAGSGYIYIHDLVVELKTENGQLKTKDGNTIDPNDHQHEKGTHHAAVAATCNSTGNVEYWDCTGDCGDKLDTSGNAIADVTLAIDASNHSGTATWTKTATTHTQTYNCCGAVVVAEANHVSSGAATETKAETCTVCGYEIAPKLTPSTPEPSNPTPSDPTPAPGKHYEEVALATGAVKDITNSSEATAETNPYSASIVNSNALETLVNVTPEEKAQGVNVWIEIVDASSTMPAADKTAIQNASGDYTVGMYLDATLFKKVGSADPIKVSDVNGKIKISVVIPENLRKEGRTFEIIRVHNGVPTVIQGTYDAATYRFTFETGQFSSYAIAYIDSDSNNGKNTTAPKTGDPYDLRAWYLLLIASLGGMLVFGGLKRKDKASK